MKEIFGLPTSTLAIWLVALLGVAILTVVLIGVFNRTWFRMGLRNLPRRGIQTVLVIAGLMLSTLITTAAFVTGDTIDNSLTKGSYDLFQRNDIDITWNGERNFDRDAGALNQGKQSYVDGSVVGAFETRFANDPRIDGFVATLYEQAGATNTTRGVSVSSVTVTGYDTARLARLGGLRLTNGAEADLDLAPGAAYLNARAAKKLQAKTGDMVNVLVNGKATPVRVAGIVENELNSGELGLPYADVPGGIALPVGEARKVFGFEDNRISALTAVLKGDARANAKLAGPAKGRIADFVSGEGKQLFGAGSGLEPGREVQVFAAKQNSVENGELSGNLFTLFFLILGLFSMAAGVMLIFTIFVMLAAERRAEMGMARAVGAQKRHLVQSFIAEGMGYALVAGVAGAAFGVLASLGLTNVLLKQVGGDYFSLVEAKVTLKSIVIGYSLGVVITFITVVFASIKAANVNIVAAIRGLPEESRRSTRRKTHWGWLIAGVPAFVIPPLGIWLVFRKGLGLPWTWILAPLGILFGLFMMQTGKSSETLAPFALGISLIPLCAASLARWFGTPNRATWSAVGVLELAYWLMPQAQHDAIFGKFDSNIEMFVISGVFIVIASTILIVFNARPLTLLFSGAGQGAKAYVAPAALFAGAAVAGVAGYIGRDAGDGLGQLAYLLAALAASAGLVSLAAARFPSAAPAFKMAVAYPLNNRFRTGMTIAMFSIIIFSLTVFSIIVGNFNALEGGDDAVGNLNLVSTTKPGSQVSNVTSALKEAGADTSAIAAEGRTTIDAAGKQVRMVGQQAWDRYPVLAADDAFLGELGPKLDNRANGYESDAAALAAVKSGSNLAMLDLSAFSPGDRQDDTFDWGVASVKVTDHRFDPFEVELRNPDTGVVTTVTVIGSLRTNLPLSTIGGIYVNEDTYRAFAGPVSYQRHYLRLAPKANAQQVAANIESALALQGVEAKSTRKILDDQQGTNLAFNRMFQAFMALGLLVGIAGLGVISFRSIVERRQQIGMLRAIGFQRGTVALTFLLESGFVAAMGIFAGVVGGSILGRNLMTGDAITDGAANLQFSLPWPEIAVVVISSLVFSGLMTWWPSRGASRVPVADALRYE